MGTKELKNTIKSYNILDGHNFAVKGECKARDFRKERDIFFELEIDNASPSPAFILESLDHPQNGFNNGKNGTLAGDNISEG